MSAGAAGGRPFGPVQMLVLSFDQNRFTGGILPELKRLKDERTVRLLDLLVVTKSEEGELRCLHVSDLGPDEAIEFGAIAGALIGCGASGAEGAAAGAVAGAAELGDGHRLDEADVWYVGDAVPNGTAAAIALLEHRWAIPLRDKVAEAGGQALADAWIHPADLLAVGAQPEDARAGAGD